MARLDGIWWTTADVAAFLGVKPSTVSSWAARGQMPAVERRVGRSPLWRPATIRAWAKQRPGKGWRKTGTA